jgi:hypothetical protein
MRMNKALNVQKKFFWLLLFSLLFSCKATIALYDQYAYTQATSLKVDLQNLALESDSISFETAKPDIDKVDIELQKAYEYNKGRDNNSISSKQYEILLADDHFYKSFLKDWKAKGKESAIMSQNISEEIGDLMDQVIKAENGKNK